MLVARLDDGGQAVVTTTDLAHVPGGTAPAVARLKVSPGTVLQEAGAPSAEAAA
jgi:DNA replication and repair protein RecF